MSKKRFLLMGSPVEHSLSPMIHRLFAKECNIDLEYQTQDVNKGDFEQALHAFMQEKGTGINLTAPIKGEAFLMCDEHTKRARLAKSVNTLTFQNNRIYGDNTDGVGWINATRDLLNLDSSNILIVGAGDVVRSIIIELLPYTSNISLINRTPEKAQKIAKEFSAIDVLTDDTLHNQYDMIINTTSAIGRDDKLFTRLPVTANLYYDLQYRKDSSFRLWCLQNKLNFEDGLSMLIQQAAIAFNIWHKMVPEQLNLQPILQEYI